MKKIIINLSITIALVGLMVAALFTLPVHPVIKVNFLATDYLNKTFAYQISTLVLSFVIILIMGLLTRFQSVKLLALNKIDGEINPEPWIGFFKKEKKDTWKVSGLSLAIIITLVTAIVIYFQVYKNGVIQTFTIGNFLIVVLFALINSFVEEITFRHTFVSIVEYHNLNRYISQGLAALIFGVGHYFGHPGKIPGVLLAGFLGWLLSKSIHETKGFFWAWLIHFLQDIVIMTALFLTLS
ncbi:MAG TPA: CPBP family intramembrane metalloprotease [Bacilli bacterium]|nr:MAG: CAAX amino terminal protease self- immunity [Tenericutes bacterium ADurb.BinA124]HNZ50032.1 CPBP family intramembrane metalloprotease [Bacilli bacterium]HPN60994.1 CPBP family intramembrane metalloprotease [Bacilli bacterium]HPX84166.1 CPBP family intramembrane metalloprotease [Bacilli bacterium]HQC74242.1 CPBP family intramembrane metalloprotease [Bacilli bacterium]